MTLIYLKKNQHQEIILQPTKKQIIKLQVIQSFKHLEIKYENIAEYINYNSQIE